MKYKFELGMKLKCIVTGFEGIVIGRNEWLNGCVQYCIKPPVDKDGKIQEGQWIDEEQLGKMKGGLCVATKQTGGPNPDAPRGV